MDEKWSIIPLPVVLFASQSVSCIISLWKLSKGRNVTAMYKQHLLLLDLLLYVSKNSVTPDYMGWK
jgi:hypothetical protein